MDPIEFLAINDPHDSMIAQTALQQAEKAADKYADSLALKIRNQIAEMMK